MYLSAQPGSNVDCFKSEELRRLKFSLSGLSDDELLARYRLEKGRELEQRAADAELEDDLRFNRFELSVDFPVWTKKAYWTLDEAVAITLGKDPLFFRWELVEPRVWESPFARKFAQLRDLLLRAMHVGQLQEKFTPREYVAWAHDAEVALPTELETLATRKDWRQQCESLEDELARREFELIETKNELARLSQRISELEAKLADNHSAAGLRTRERNSLLKIIYGVAVSRFRYNPDKGRSGVPKRIADACVEAGVPIDEETVLKWLREATRVVSPSPFYS